MTCSQIHDSNLTLNEIDLIMIKAKVTDSYLALGGSIVTIVQRLTHIRFGFGGCRQLAPRTIELAVG